MGDAPHWKLKYAENKNGKPNHQKGQEIGHAFDNWIEWPIEEKTVLSQRIILKEDLTKGDVLFLEPTPTFTPNIQRYSKDSWDFYWRKKDDDTYYAHAFLNKGKTGPYFKIYIEEDLLAGEIYQNPRKESEDMITRGETK